MSYAMGRYGVRTGIMSLTHPILLYHGDTIRTPRVSLLLNASGKMRTLTPEYSIALYSVSHTD